MRQRLHHAEDAAGAVFRHSADGVRQVKNALEHPRRAAAALLDVGNARRYDKAGRDRRQLRAARTADAVAERAELLRVRVVVGDRPDARDMVAQRNTEPVAARRFLGRDKKFRLLRAAPHGQDQAVSLLNAGAEPLRGADGFAVHRNDRVARAQPGCLRRRAVRNFDDHEPLRIELDADGVAAGNQIGWNGGEGLHGQQRRQNQSGGQPARRCFHVCHTCFILSCAKSHPLNMPDRDRKQSGGRLVKTSAFSFPERRGGCSCRTNGVRVRQPLPVQEGILNECFSIRRVCKYFLRKCRNLS